MTEGNIRKRNPRKATGLFHKTKGSVKEALGHTFRAPNLERSGAQEHAEGLAECRAAAGQGSPVHGTKDQIIGKKDQVVGSLTGDHAQQARGEQRHAQGVAERSWKHPSKGHK